MKLTRRAFVRHGLSAFTVGLAAPAFLSDLARAQGALGRNLVVLFMGGGNDALSMLVPYTDSFYYSRRPTIAIPAGNVLQVGTDSSGVALGLHPNLVGLRALFDQGRLALIQRTGYENSSRSHFTGTDIWGTAIPSNPATTGWLGRYLDTLPEPVDPLIAWDAQREVPRALFSRNVSVPAIPNVSTYTYASPNAGTEAALERATAQRIASHVPVDRPHLGFVNDNITSAMATLDRVAKVAAYAPTVTYPTASLGQTMKAVAGAIARQIGTKIFWVQTGGYDTHATQVGASGAYPRLMIDLNDALAAFYNDLNNQGLMGDTLVVAFSEFGRRAHENGSVGSDHGAAGLMFAFGGQVRGGLYGTAASLNPVSSNPTLENNGNDVRHETDFRAVYARVFDAWLGVDSVPLLGGNFRNGGLGFV
ncbi:MAG: DUF1501 domain-containing protein [Vicinamibacterales bacterium]|nr:DUF1501 domain-containing protein [Vicinamibacterales bacterium]